LGGWGSESVKVLAGTLAGGLSNCNAWADNLVGATNRHSFVCLAHRSGRDEGALR
jgi:hypothetical protein